MICANCPTTYTGGECPNCQTVWNNRIGYPPGHDPVAAGDAHIDAVQAMIDSWPADRED